jgi:hypothetical protein
MGISLVEGGGIHVQFLEYMRTRGLRLNEEFPKPGRRSVFLAGFAKVKPGFRDNQPSFGQSGGQFISGR